MPKRVTKNGACTPTSSKTCIDSEANASPIEFETYTVPEACAAAGIKSRGLLYRLIRDGLGPKTIKLGRRRLIRRQALREWLEQMEVGS